jgi:hypothetical protein
VHAGFSAKQKGGQNMALRGCFIGLVSACVFMVGIWLLGSVSEVKAETLNFKMFTHATKTELVPIADAAGHVMGVQVREGAMVLESGELGWVKATLLLDLVKGAGTHESYTTHTLTDGSTFTTHNKGSVEATPMGATSGAKFTGEVVRGTGRFQGVKGTTASSPKFFPSEMGDLGGKGLAEVTLEYTLPGK